MLSEGTFLLGQKIFQQVRQDIISGKYAQGEELKELLIADLMGVSRTPVREALRQLEQEGLVTIIPNKGTYVVGVTRQDMKDIYDIRISLEGLCARRAAREAALEQIEALEEILYLTEYRMRKEDTGKEHEKHLIELCKRFHEGLYEACASRMLKRILHNHYLYLEQVRMGLFDAVVKSGEAVREHWQILEAVKERDEEKAEHAAMLHITNTIKTIDSYGWENITGGQKDGEN